LSAVTRSLQFFRGTVGEERLDPVLNEMVRVRTNALVTSSQLMALALLNTDGDPVVTAGNTNLLVGLNLAEAEHWAGEFVTFVLPVEGASVSPEGVTNNPTVVLPKPPFRDPTNGPPRGRDFPRGQLRPGEMNSTNDGTFFPTNSPASFTNADGEIVMPPPPDGGRRPPDGGDRLRNGGNRRPPWMRGMTEDEFKKLIAKRELHGLVLVMSTEKYRATSAQDWLLRGVIGFFAGISALGASLAWRNTGRTAELQIRLVRASDLKELNLAAAGLAHETRNPLNIIRGQAQMVSRLPDASPEVREKSKTIIDQTDKVTAQLTEFINYSRPREVRRTKIDLSAAIKEVIRTLNFDIDEKKLRVETNGETLAIEADEQLVRQVLFNLLLNAIQAADAGGEIKFSAARTGANTAALEIRDNGPGVPPERRLEIFKPYFTTHQKGTGLGLAVVQQIVLAHGWEIECLGNTPKGAIFRISHLKIAA
jgi:signal transduction histidine kinase